MSWDVPQAEFLSQVRRYAALRTERHGMRFYEAMKAQALAEFPHLPGHQWNRLMDEIARICDV
jgi:hypothetical protein